MPRLAPSRVWDDPRLLEMLQLITRRAYKFKGSSSESLAAHPLAQFYIRRFYTAHCYLPLQRELKWKGCSLKNAQTPARRAAWTEPFFSFWPVEPQVSFFGLHRRSQTLLHTFSTATRKHRCVCVCVCDWVGTGSIRFYCFTLLH